MLRNILLLLLLAVIHSISPAVSHSAGGTWNIYLDSNRVEDMAVEGPYIWCATSGGVVRWNGNDGTYVRYTPLDGLPGNRVKAVAVDNTGTKWFIGEWYGITSFDGVAWKTYEHEVFFGGNQKRLAVDKKNAIWSAGAGTWNFDGTTWKKYALDEGVTSAVAVDNDNQIWFGTKNGAVRYDGVTWMTYTTEHGLPDNNVRTLTVDKKGMVWAGTSKGVASFDGTTWTTYSWKDYTDQALQGNLTGNTVYTTAVDNSNDKWFGTAWSGAASFDGSAWTIYTPDNSGLKNREIWGIVADSNTVWFAYNPAASDHAITKFDSATWIHYTTEGPLSNIVRGVQVDENNVKRFWTNDGISIFDGMSWTQYSGEDYLSVWQNEINSVIDLEGVKWFGTPQGVISFDGTTRKSYTKADGLVSDNVIDVAVDGKNVKWFCTDRGVSTFDGVTWTTYDESNGFVSSNVRGITIDSNDNKWFAVPQKGLCRFDGVNWKYLDSENSGLNDNYVTNVVADHNDVLWISMAFNKGLQSYDGIEWKTYTRQDGFIPAEILSIAVDRDNVKWFGTYDYGILRYDDSIMTGLKQDVNTQSSIMIQGAFPNPFNTSTVIRFSTAIESPVTVTVFSITGQKIRELVSERLPVGIHSARWDGCDENGGRVSSGIYMVRLKAGDVSSSSRVLLLK